MSDLSRREFFRTAAVSTVAVISESMGLGILSGQSLESDPSFPELEIIGAEKLFPLLEDVSESKQLGDALVNAIQSFITNLDWGSALSDNPSYIDDDGTIVSEVPARLDPSKKIKVLFIRDEEQITPEMDESIGSRTFETLTTLRKTVNGLGGTHSIDLDGNPYVAIFLNKNDSYRLLDFKYPDGSGFKKYTAPNNIKTVIGSIAHELSHAYWNMNERNAATIEMAITGIVNNASKIPENGNYSPMPYEEYKSTAQAFKLHPDYCIRNEVYCVENNVEKGAVGVLPVDEASYNRLIEFFYEIFGGVENWNNIMEKTGYDRLDREAFCDRFPASCPPIES